PTPRSSDLDRRQPELRHARLPQLRPLRLRRRRLRHPGSRPGRVGPDRGRVQRLLRRPGPGHRPDGVRLPLRRGYGGEGPDTPVAAPAGSAQIEPVFNAYFAGQGLATDPTAFDGRSDYGPFIGVGIPAGGLFSGAEGTKTAGVG